MTASNTNHSTSLLSVDGHKTSSHSSTSRLHFTLTLFLICLSATMLRAQTWAEKLGYPKDARVLILHVDDAGMSLDSNEGAIKAMSEGVANSVSVMMPCPWVPGFVNYLKQHPQTDAGLHLTLTSEWDWYRWGPLSGKPAVPGLVDTQGALWGSVAEVVQHASADEVYTEIKAQLERARGMGFEPTHIDSHMGTLFGSPDYIRQYVRLGVENKIPVMIPGGHNTAIVAELKREGNAQAEATGKAMSDLGKTLWAAGLPVLDDLHNVSYGWKYEKYKTNYDEAALRKEATANYIESIKVLKPGLTMVIMHCTEPSPRFAEISASGLTRKADLLVMTDPAFKKFLTDNKVILTTWREVAKRRAELKN